MEHWEKYPETPFLKSSSFQVHLFCNRLPRHHKPQIVFVSFEHFHSHPKSRPIIKKCGKVLSQPHFVGIFPYIGLIYGRYLQWVPQSFSKFKSADHPWNCRDGSSGDIERWGYLRGGWQFTAGITTQRTRCTRDKPRWCPPSDVNVGL